jgi:hypothetical protein
VHKVKQSKALDELKLHFAIAILVHGRDTQHLHTHARQQQSLSLLALIEREGVDIDTGGAFNDELGSRSFFPEKRFSDFDQTRGT